MIMDHQKCSRGSISRLHWTAIFAGALVGVGLGFLLNIYSMAIGLSAYTSSPTGATVIAIGGVIALLIGVVVSMGIAGFVTGYLGRFYHCECHAGIIYGFITWTIALMFSALLIVPLSHYVSFYEENLNPGLALPEVSQANAAVSIKQQKITSQQAIDINSKQLASTTCLLFGLFFLGALSSCIGACYGMGCRKEENIHEVSSQDPPAEL